MSDELFGSFKEDLELDSALDACMARIELDGQFCCLKHGPESMGLPPVPVVDYLCQNLGNHETGEVSEQIRVPICEECLKGLHDPNWALLYCVTCHSNQWIYKPRSSHNFHSDVVWLNECPKCAKKEDG
jgi:hypothetical protein